MTHRPPHDDECQFALWNSKRMMSAREFRSVVVAHADIALGELLALLLRLNEFHAIAIPDMETVELMFGHWWPSALLMDTRLGRRSNFRFIRDAAVNPAFRSVLIVALTSNWRELSPGELRRVGFDGLCRRPCQAWRLADMLNEHFHLLPGQF
ncbi:hypothetical protein R75461_07180 [Paraburkholderia nemoris]|uniref:response regulator n=1 Tax=Paraburkholderia nemoris TaxID=2793076 RepID=UPI00190DBFC5|nr:MULTISPECIES: response regulator [Paraburkholderia]MBK3786678.1 response regulator [Paraburkholderia aspalathi]CAE6844496.1 hypothetical protein R75461_07180 [Paraburkholderia nemoris]